MGIESSAEYGGAESSFTSAIIVIEELAKVDPSVSVLCDVHNTLVNTVLRKYGTKEQQDKWLPQLAQSKVFSPSANIYMSNVPYNSWAHSVSRSLPQAQTRLPSKHVPKRMVITGSSTAPRCGSQTLTRPKFFLSLPT